MRAILLSGGLAVVCSLLGTWVAIGWFTRHGFGQPIRDDGPTTHHVKRGTPTMGGLVILASATAAYLMATILTGGLPSASAWLLLLLFVGCGVVGFLDDFIKVYTQNNQGLSSRAKMAGQSLVALGFGLLATRFFADERGVRPASSYISTTHDVGFKLPLVVVLLVIWFIVTATSNGANLTDGADGLLAGTSAMIFGAYTLVNIWQNNQRCGSSRPTVVESQCYQVRDPLDLAVLAVVDRGVHQPGFPKLADVELDMGPLDADQRVQPVGLAPGEPTPQLVGIQAVGAPGVSSQVRHRRELSSRHRGWLERQERGRTGHEVTSRGDIRNAQTPLAANAARHSERSHASRTTQTLPRPLAAERLGW